MDLKKPEYKIANQIPPLINFPDLIQIHLNKVANTLSLEIKATALIEDDFPDSQLRDFIRCVCIWGGYPGIAGRILKQNEMPDLQAQFRQAQNATTPTEALVVINGIKQLGSPSFASKHLRFLQPQVYPVLDRIIAQRLVYDLNPKEYGRFAADCTQIAAQLQAEDIVNPINRPQRVWYAADVEMAIFANLYWN
jgi:hypothetical protein